MDSLQPALSYDGSTLRPWQNRLRRKLRQIIAMPQVARPPLNVRRLWLQQDELGRIEKITFVAEEHCDIVAYFCTPRHVSPPYPTVICLQGHSTGMHLSIARDAADETRVIEVEGGRDFALGAMHRGFAALCIEQRSFGERREKAMKRAADHPCQDAAMHALMLGRTLAGERVFDVDRGLDYLERRGDIDLKCVGVMGDSGGGTISLYSAALLPRIRFAMPACAFCTFRDSILAMAHCPDNYLPGLLQYAEAADIAGLFAPKPLVIVHGKLDPIFPISATRRAFSDLQEIYAANGAPENCALVVGSGGHQFYEDLGWKHLLKLLRK